MHGKHCCLLVLRGPACLALHACTARPRSLLALSTKKSCVSSSFSTEGPWRASCVSCSCVASSCMRHVLCWVHCKRSHASAFHAIGGCRGGGGPHVASGAVAVTPRAPHRRGIDVLPPCLLPFASRGHLDSESAAIRGRRPRGRNTQPIAMFGATKVEFELQVWDRKIR